MKDQLDKRKSIVFRTPPKNYRDAYADADEKCSTVILPQNDNILPHVDPLDMGKESWDDYFQTDCRGIIVRKVNWIVLSLWICCWCGSCQGVKCLKVN